MSTLDTAGLSNNGKAAFDAAARRAEIADMVDALESVLTRMDKLGLTTAALHVSLGLEIARGGGPVRPD